MKKIFFLVTLASLGFATHAQNWLTAGNTLGANGTFGSIDNKKINFISHNKKRGALTGDGLWGFGTTSPLAEVHINSSDSSINILQLDAFDSAKMVVSSSGGISIGNANVPPANGLYVAGKVGIGTNTPDVKLHVVGGNEVTLASGGTLAVGSTTDQNLVMDRNEIQARNNGATSTLHLNKLGGDVNIASGNLFFQSATKRLGINTTSPSSALHVDGGLHLFKLSERGYFTIGSTGSNNIVMDDDHIQARNNGDKSTLYLNAFGGDISLGNLFDGSVGIGTSLPEVKLQVIGGADATLSGGGYIVAGPTSFKNVVIDAHGMQARNNGGKADLYLNYDLSGSANGGTYVGGELGVSSGTLSLGLRIPTTLQAIDANHPSLRVSSDFTPSVDNVLTLGSSSKRWMEVWADDGSINTSDARDKKNIRDLNYGLKEIMQLYPVKFNWKDEHNPDDKLGLIAQDLQKVLPEVVRSYEYKTDSSGRREKIASTRLGVMYADIIPVIIKGMQQQQAIIEDQNKKIEALAQLVTNLTSTPQTKNIQTESNAKSIVLNDASLEQNIPNPFTNYTSIHYNLPPNVKNAQLIMNDMNGKIVKQVSINKAGAGVINIESSLLSAGVYSYTLFANGKAISTKKMVVAKLG